VELLAGAGVDLTSKRVALVGRGDTVGRPLASLLIKRNATITICHTRTVDIPSITRSSEIVVVAAGRAGLVTGDMLSTGQVVIDAGINAKDGGGIIGDVDFDKAKLDSINHREKSKCLTKRK
jgi:methylenetetrahydrofolate dehydrogenase (NADP+)/methenyltetrahydrofolate cyclohydrolase